jgi:hypothetical protein
MKNIFRKLKQLFCKTNIIETSVESDFGKCTKCRFADFDNNRCTVGSYYAEKGYNKICFEGELWQTLDR